MPKGYENALYGLAGAAVVGVPITVHAGITAYVRTRDKGKGNLNEKDIQKR